jgi:hypothetical protein
MADKFVGTHLLVKTHRADEALEANRFVKLVTATGLQPHVVYADAGEAAVGVTRDKYALSDYSDIIKIGEAFVMTSENVAAGQAVSADADGKAQVAGGAEQVLGQAQTDANSGDPVLVLLSLGGIF